MNLVQGVGIGAFILCVALYAFLLFFKMKGNVLESVVELIAMAERSGLVGSEKMRIVVDQLYEKIPAGFRPFLTKEKLQEFAQWIFDWMRKYAIAYVDAHKDSVINTEADVKIRDDMASDLIVQLVGMSKDGLLEMAKLYGVDMTSENKEEEIVKAIVVAIISKVR